MRFVLPFSLVFLLSQVPDNAPDVTLHTRNGGKLTGKLTTPFITFRADGDGPGMTTGIPPRLLVEVWFEIGSRVRVKYNRDVDEVMELAGVINGNDRLKLVDADGKESEVYVSECMHLVVKR